MVSNIQGVTEHSIMCFHVLLEHHIFHVVLQINFYGVKVWRDVGCQSVDHDDQAINQVNSEEDTFSLHIWNGEAFCHAASVTHLCFQRRVLFKRCSISFSRSCGWMWHVWCPMKKNVSNTYWWRVLHHTFTSNWCSKLLSPVPWGFISDSMWGAYVIERLMG